MTLRRLWYNLPRPVRIGLKIKGLSILAACGLAAFGLGLLAGFWGFIVTLDILLSAGIDLFNL